MSEIDVKKAEPFLLKTSEFDEKWLQNYIEDDPSILGLGELRILARERKQSSGGRIDFLMKDDESDIIYEIEIMLGKLDESHIIRTIEYWDIERRKNPSYEHIAVIVAEDITNRFFNVISLINRSLPIIALKLSAIKISNSMILNFIKVLDTSESSDIDDEIIEEKTNRAYWDKKVNNESMKIFDRLVELLKENGIFNNITYNKYHIALAAPRRNFCVSHPRKNPGCLIDIIIGEENINKLSQELEEVGFQYNVSRKKNNIRFKLTTKIFEKHKDLILKLLKLGYEYCS